MNLPARSPLVEIESGDNTKFPQLDPVTVGTLRENLLKFSTPDAKFAAYQNHELSSNPAVGYGNITYLKVGPGCTYADPPKMIDPTGQGSSKRAVFVGLINLDEGVIECLKEGERDSDNADG